MSAQRARRDQLHQFGWISALFKNTIPGFSLEERTEPEFWWCGDPAVDPWEWRALIARSGEVAYGKFFEKKAGFISKKWMPCFFNYRRDGYDFDALWEDEKATKKQKKIMDLFETEEEFYSNELKAKTIAKHMLEFYPDAEENAVKKILGKTVAAAFKNLRRSA